MSYTSDMYISSFRGILPSCVATSIYFAWGVMKSDFSFSLKIEYDSNKNLTDYDEENLGCQSGDDDGKELNFD